MMINRYKLTPVREVATTTTLGIQLLKKCNHARIPGLDADFCEVCRIYFVDQKERDKFYARKRSAY